ncbi:CD151 antigen-like [Liolophura sinensis]|uniref:CD151 antigen-like n=1 Tax=Liolophura sinensis TaxID=3198878 RepID=UPI003159364D
MKSGAKCIGLCLVIYNIICFILGAVILGIGIWTAVDRIFLSEIIGTYLYSAASYLLITGGGIILIVSFVGGFGACTKMRCMLITYFGLLVLIFLCLVLAAILAVVFRGEIENTMKMTMRDTLINKYGVNVHGNDENFAVTKAWDETQWRFECCAVDDSMDWDYRVYRTSNWFQETQLQQSPENQKFVPETCCKRITVDQSDRYKNLEACQQPLLPIPPKGDPSFGDNDSFNSKGCFSTGYELVMSQAGIILGMGFAFALALILGMVITVLLYRSLSHEETGGGGDERDDQL